MKTYKPKYSELLGALFISALFLSFTSFILIRTPEVEARDNSNSFLQIAGSMSVIFVAFGLTFLFAALQAAAIYEVDAESISVRSLFGCSKIAWNNITYAEVSGATESDIHIRNALEAAITLDTSVIENGSELRATVLQKLEPVLAGLKEQWSENGVVLKPKTPFRSACITTLVVFIYLCGVGFFAAGNMPRNSASDTAGAIVMQVLALLGIGLFGWLAAYVFRQRLSVNRDEIRIDSVGYHRTIKLSDIASVSTRDTENNTTRFRFVTVRDRSGTKITISSQYPNYTVLQQIVMEGGGARAITEGEQDLKKHVTREKITQRKFLVYASPLYLGIFLVPGVLTIRQGRERVDAFAYTEKYGVRVMATVTGKETRGSKSTEYVLDYSFPASLSGASVKTITAASPLTYDNWLYIRTGQQEPAIYVPSEPQKCHLRLSISGELGARKVKMGIFYSIMGIFGAAMYVGAMVQSIRKAAGTLKDPTIPAAAVALNAPERFRLQREVTRIGIARMAGMRVMSIGMSIVMAECVIFLLGAASLGYLGDASHAHDQAPAWILYSILVPALLAVSGAMVIAPLGEFYAYLTTKRLEQTMADPEIATDLALALRRSAGADKAYTSTASLRLINAITAILATNADAAKSLAEPQRYFLYALLSRWCNAEDRAPFCIATLQAMAVWGDTAALADVRRIAHSSSIAAVRAAATDTLQIMRPNG